MLETGHRRPGQRLDGRALRRWRRLLGRGRGATMARWGVVSGEGRRGVRGVGGWVALGGERRRVRGRGRRRRRRIMLGGPLSMLGRRVLEEIRDVHGRGAQAKKTKTLVRSRSPHVVSDRDLI